MRTRTEIVFGLRFRQSGMLRSDTQKITVVDKSSGILLFVPI